MRCWDDIAGACELCSSEVADEECKMIWLCEEHNGGQIGKASISKYSIVMQWTHVKVVNHPYHGR